MLPVDTVEVTDPAHPLYGLTLPLVGVATKRDHQRVCVVWLHPGVERAVPAAATSLAGAGRPRSPCRLCLPAIAALLAVIASLPGPRQEDAHAPRLAATIPPPPRQLPLPLSPPRAAPPTAPPTPVATLRAEQVWSTLSAEARARVRRGLRDILRELIEREEGAEDDGRR